MTGMATSGSTGTGGLGGSGGGGKKDGDKKDDKKEYKNGNPMGLLKKPAKPRAPKVCLHSYPILFCSPPPLLTHSR